MPRSRQRFSNPSAVQQLPRSVRMRVTRKGKAAIASSRKALAAASVSSSLTARWTRRERRSMATNRKRLRHSPSAVRSLGRCFTSTWTKPTSYSLNLPAAFSGVARTGRRLRPSALRMRYTLSRPRCGRKCRTTKVRSSSGKPVARRRAHTTARSSSLPFHGSLCGRLDRSRQSATPRLRHLRTVSVLTPKRPASSPVGSLERAISARTAGVVRALGWIESIRPSLQPRALVRGRRSATRTPRSPNALGPNNVPQPDKYALPEPLIPPAKPGGRPRTTDLRRLLDGLFHLVRTGCQWRHLPPPPAFPSWRTVYGYMRAFADAGVWESIRHHLVVMLRERDGKEPGPSAAIIDTQSVKATEKGGLAATMRPRRSRAGSGTSRSTPAACCWASSSTPPTSRTRTVPATSCGG